MFLEIKYRVKWMKWKKKRNEKSASQSTVPKPPSKRCENDWFIPKTISHCRTDEIKWLLGLPDWDWLDWPVSIFRCSVCKKNKSNSDSPQCILWNAASVTRRRCHRPRDIYRIPAWALRTICRRHDFYAERPKKTEWIILSHHFHDFPHPQSAKKKT